MQPWRTLDSHDTPDGKLVLRQRGERDFLLSIDGRVLMTSMLHRSEDALSALAVERMSAPAPRVLTAGLGLGFTLRALLDRLPVRAHVTVAELHGPIERWARGPLAVVNGAALDDRRTEVVIRDVMEVVREAADGIRPPFDAIVLDLMEGPSATRGRATAHLYGARALAMVRAALTPDGVFAVWGEEPYPPFVEALQRAGMDARRVIVGSGPKHVVYVARPSRGPRGGILPHPDEPVGAPRAMRPPRPSGGALRPRGKGPRR